MAVEVAVVVIRIIIGAIAIRWLKIISWLEVTVAAASWSQVRRFWITTHQRRCQSTWDWVLVLEIIHRCHHRHHINIISWRPVVVVWVASGATFPIRWAVILYLPQPHNSNCSINNNSNKNINYCCSINSWQRPTTRTYWAVRQQRHRAHPRWHPGKQPPDRMLRMSAARSRWSAFAFNRVRWSFINLVDSYIDWSIDWLVPANPATCVLWAIVSFSFPISF